MSVELLVGPANCEKHQHLLADCRARLGERPVLVACGSHHLERLERELCAEGAVFGARVVTARGLFELVQRSCGATVARAPVSSQTQRQLIVAETLQAQQLRWLGGSAGRDGVVRVLERFFSELGWQALGASGFEAAVSQWRASTGAPGISSDLVWVYAAYQARLAELGILDPPGLGACAIETLRQSPTAWRAPVFFWDLGEATPLELDLVEALDEAGVDVYGCLSFEADRAAFSHTARAFERLTQLRAARIRTFVRPPRASASEDLVHLERGLFDTSTTLSPQGSISLLAAGGERAEIELVGAKILQLVRAGTAPGQIAIVLREPQRYWPLLDQVLSAYGISFAGLRTRPLSQTALGRGLVGLGRCAAGQADSAQLMAYLRTPGVLADTRSADAVEAELRRRGIASVAAASKLLGADHPALAAIDRLAAAEEGLAFVRALAEEADRLFAAPRRRAAEVLDGRRTQDARAAATARRVLGDLAELLSSARPPACARDQAVEALTRAPVSHRIAADCVQILSAEETAGAHFECVFICGLQEGEFPRAGHSDPCLTDDERTQLAAVTGTSLPLAHDDIERERYLFYQCATSADRRLFLSWRLTDEEGSAQQRSFFVEEVKDLFDPKLSDETEYRPISQVTWPLDLAPTTREWQRAAALAGPRSQHRPPQGLKTPVVRADLAGRTEFSASGLEAFANCGVRWLVERLLSPRRLEADPEPLVRGRHAHDVLRATYERLVERFGTARITSANLAYAQDLAEKAVTERVSQDTGSVHDLVAAERLKLDVWRLLRAEAENASSFEPRSLELGFGGPADGLPALWLGADGAYVRGRIDRVDTFDGQALVRDYKSSGDVFPAAKWPEQNRLQLALYLIAVQQLCSLEPAGGVYVPLSGRDRRPRGLLCADADADLGAGFVSTDYTPPDQFQAALEQARITACELVSQIRAGNARPCPQTCECAYPSICRHEHR